MGSEVVKNKPEKRPKHVQKIQYISIQNHQQFIEKRYYKIIQIKNIP